MLLVIGYLAYLWQRGKKQPPIAQAASRVEVLKQVRTQAPQGKLKINPARFSQEAVIINESAKVIIPQHPIPPSAKAPLDHADSAELWENMDILGQDELGTRSKIAATVDRMIGEFHSSPDRKDDGQDKLNNATPFIIRRRAPTLKLPVPLLGQFEGRFGEKLLWHGPFWHRPGLDGWFAVTNQRLIWTTERKKMVLAKDLLRSELDRGQIGIPAIFAADVAHVRLPGFLFTSCLFVLFFPYGTTLSLALVTAYLAVKRPMLRVATREEVLFYPLKANELRDAAKCIAKLLSDKEEQANQADTKQDSWRKAN